MRPSKARFVTSCQQLLALGAVLAVLTPAASVISLDVVTTPGSQPSAGRQATSVPSGDLSSPPRPRATPDTAESPSGADAAPAPRATVPVEAVEPVVVEVPLRADAPAQPARPEEVGGPSETPRDAAPRPRDRTVVSEPQRVTGYGAVGITWSSEDVDEQGDRDDHDHGDEDFVLQVRTATGGTWSGWTDLEYHDDHAAEPGTAEAERARPGTEPLLVGRVDRVQARVTARHGLPRDLSLAVVDPGRAEHEAKQAPELVPGTSPDPARQEQAGEEDALELQAGSTTVARPRIFSRQQWGADERLRDGSPSYGTIKAGFVHHTVNANSYSRSDVPGILRSIYAYHTQSRGWSDIGYNFLVDRFGRIWEGRAGGVKRPVIGAHTYGYNHESFAMSAIGNFETAQPSTAMLKAYGNLFAWKLGLHGVNPGDTNQVVAGRRLRAINGHRDAGSTACPGRHLYAKLPAIRQYAADADQEPEVPAEPEVPEIALNQVDSDLVGSRFPDLVVRRASDGRGLVVPTGGITWFRPPRVVAQRWGTRPTLAVPDLTGDDRVDVVSRDETGALEVRPMLPSGRLGAVQRRMTRFRAHQLLASAGRLDGDERPDFVARQRGRLVSFLSNRRGGYRRVVTTTSLRGARQVVGAGDVTADGRTDLWVRDRRGRLHLHRGLGRGRFSPREQVAGSWSRYDWFAGGVDYTTDGVPDLIARTTAGTLDLVPGRGDGTLGRAVGPVRGKGLAMISGAGQLVDGDAPDLVATTASGSLVVVPNRGTFNLGAPVDTGRSFARGDLLLNAGDFSGDGHGDAIMRRRNGSLWLYRGHGNGRLQKPVRLGGRHFRTVVDLRVTADVTGDGKHDLVGRRAGEPWTLWAGNGSEPVSVGSEVRVVEPRRPQQDAQYEWLLSISDLAGRGAADVVARDRQGHLYRLDGRKRGFRAPRYLGEGVAYDLGG